MVSKPCKGYTEVHELTCFVTWLRSRWTFNYRTNKHLGIMSNSEAHYRNYCANRRLKRMNKSHRHIPLVSMSINSETISVLE